MLASVKSQVKIVLGALASAAGLSQRKFRSQLTVVAFHRVSNVLPEDGLTCSPEKFDKFCAFFAKHFRVVPFADQVRGCAAGHDMGGTLSITFDDGYLDNYEVAAPILKKHGLPATFFVTTGFVNSNSIPFWDKELPRQPGWMSWEQVRDLSRQGFDIGAHTHSHLDMAASPLEQVETELQQSKHILEAELGKPVDLFVYPFGGPTQINEHAIERVKAAGFISCASCFGGVNPPVADPYRLRRIGIAEWFTSPYQFGFELLVGKA